MRACDALFFHMYCNPENVLAVRGCMKIRGIRTSTKRMTRMFFGTILRESVCTVLLVRTSIKKDIISSNVLDGVHFNQYARMLDIFFYFSYFL